MKNTFFSLCKNILRNKNIQLLFILLVIILLVGLSYKNVEGFGLDSLSSSVTDTSNKVIPEKYQYLAPLPEGSVWSQELQDKYIAKLKSKNPNDPTTKEQLSTPNPFLGNKSLMQLASSSEVQYYLDNDMWPYDEYVVNYLTKELNPPISATNLENTRKQIPNRGVYLLAIERQTVPQIKMLGEIFSGTLNNKTDNGKYWHCDSGSLKVKDGENGEEKTITDYSFFPNNITGFSFEGESCNVCEIPQTKIDTTGIHTLQDYYDSPNNKCKFKMTNEVPEAYNVYIGKYGNVPSESVPSESESGSSGIDYQKCISSCDKYKE